MTALAIAMMCCSEGFAQEGTTTGTGFFDRLDYTVKVGLGWCQMGKEDVAVSNYSSDVKGRLAYTLGVGAEYLLDPTWGLSAELEWNIKGHQLESNYGGLTGSSDFTETTTYTVHYLSIPVKVVWHNQICPLSLGLVTNVPVVSNKSSDRTGTGLSGVGGSDSGKIKNLNSPVWSLRIGLGDKKSLYGFTVEGDFMLSKNYDNSAFRQYFTTSIYYVF